MIACSRNFGIVVNGLRTSALVPFADMLNHLRPRETKWTFDSHTQNFTITSLTAIQPGAQVYDSYGKKCNHRFLLNYGFSLENNIEDDGSCPNEIAWSFEVWYAATVLVMCAFFFFFLCTSQMCVFLFTLY